MASWKSRDRLVVGIRDLSSSEKLQTDPGLTLERAKTMIGQKAAAKEHRWELQGDQEAALNRLWCGNWRRISKGKVNVSPLSDNRSHYNRGGANKQTSKEPQCHRYLMNLATCNSTIKNITQWSKSSWETAGCACIPYTQHSIETLRGTCLARDRNKAKRQHLMVSLILIAATCQMWPLLLGTCLSSATGLLLHNAE